MSLRLGYFPDLKGSDTVLLTGTSRDIAPERVDFPKNGPVTGERSKVCSPPHCVPDMHAIGSTATKPCRRLPTWRGNLVGQNRKLRGVLQSGPSTVLLSRTASLPLTRKGGA
jgi:hypothetical protein